MANVSVYNMEGSEVSKMDLNDKVFAVNVNEHLIHMAVTLQLANKRQGTQKAKTRSEVRGGGKKPWKQKGTGHARQGSIRAPQWKGGGVVFAPVPRDYSFKMNKKEKANAMKSALTSRVNEDKFLVMDSLKFDEIKTKENCIPRKNLYNKKWRNLKFYSIDIIFTSSSFGFISVANWCSTSLSSLPLKSNGRL